MSINLSLYWNCFHFSFPEGQVTGRGCSTKDKVFYKECETHSYGEQVEKMCFCSYFLCNKAGEPINPNFLLIIGATMFCVLLNSCQHAVHDRVFSSSTRSYDGGQNCGLLSTNRGTMTAASLESCDKAHQQPPGQTRRQPPQLRLQKLLRQRTISQQPSRSKDSANIS